MKGFSITRYITYLAQISNFNWQLGEAFINQPIKPTKGFLDAIKLLKGLLTIIGLARCFEHIENCVYVGIYKGEFVKEWRAANTETKAELIALYAKVFNIENDLAEQFIETALKHAAIFIIE